MMVLSLGELSAQDEINFYFIDSNLVDTFDFGQIEYHYEETGTDSLRYQLEQNSQRLIDLIEALEIE